jgi:hypothetical protein
MTCRHANNDPSCTGYKGRVADARSLIAEDDNRNGRTPDSARFEVIEAVEVQGTLVLRVLYPNCEKCAYEGHKVLVYPRTSALDALKWRVIDPHFREDSKRSAIEAPAPAARFPASDKGWRKALAYAAWIGGQQE